MNQKTKKVLKIVGIIIIVILLLFVSSEVFGAITETTAEDLNLIQKTGNFLRSTINFVVLGPLSLALAVLASAILAVIELILNYVFGTISLNGYMPTIDDIIFNKLAFFDPNFINPSDGSPVDYLSDIISNLYYTSFLIAGSIFVISAMVIGIKLVVSTIASDKAHYKEMLTVWLTCLVTLFFAHILMLVVFTVNEEIVSMCSVAADTFVIENNWEDRYGVTVGSLLGTITDFLEDVTDKDFTSDYYGYGGLLIYFRNKSIGGDIIGTIVWGVMLGQTCAIIVQYLKRLFYCIILGLLAPLIIAADVIKKSM